MKATYLGCTHTITVNDKVLKLQSEKMELLSAAVILSTKYPEECSRQRLVQTLAGTSGTTEEWEAVCNCVEDLMAKAEEQESAVAGA